MHQRVEMQYNRALERISVQKTFMIFNVLHRIITKLPVIL